MQTNSRNLRIASSAAILATAVLFGGCAVQGPSPVMAFEQQVANARSASDHQNLAAQYEQQARTDQAKAEEHVKASKAYVAYAGKSGPSMGAHCKHLAETYQSAADESLSMAQIHRQLAQEAK